MSQVEEYKATFNRFDADGSGSIDAEELGKLIRELCKLVNGDRDIVHCIISSVKLSKSKLI